MAKDLINRDPFCGVQLAPVMHGGKETDKMIVEMQDEDGRWQPLTGVSSVHGQDYVLVPNQQVYSMVSDVLTRTGGKFEPVPTFGGGHSKPQHWNGRSFSAKWFSREVAEDLSGSVVALGVEAVNSYDGSAPVGIRFFAMHCLCSNQFYYNNLLGSFIFKHVNREAGIQLNENVDDALRLMRQQADKFVQFLPVMKMLKDRKVDGVRGLLKFREAANEAFWTPSRDGAMLDALSGRGVYGDWDIRVDQTADPSSYWRLLNAYSAVCTHQIGGFRGSSLSDQATTFTFAQAGIEPGKAMAA